MTNGNKTCKKYDNFSGTIMLDYKNFRNFEKQFTVESASVIFYLKMYSALKPIDGQHIHTKLCLKLANHDESDFRNLSSCSYLYGS